MYKPFCKSLSLVMLWGCWERWIHLVGLLLMFIAFGEIVSMLFEENCIFGNLKLSYYLSIQSKTSWDPTKIWGLDPIPNFMGGWSIQCIFSYQKMHIHTTIYVLQLVFISCRPVSLKIQTSIPKNALKKGNILHVLINGIIPTIKTSSSIKGMHQWLIADHAMICVHDLCLFSIPCISWCTKMCQAMIPPMHQTMCQAMHHPMHQKNGFI